MARQRWDRAPQPQPDPAHETEHGLCSRSQVMGPALCFRIGTRPATLLQRYLRETRRNTPLTRIRQALGMRAIRRRRVTVKTVEPPRAPRLHGSNLGSTAIGQVWRAGTASVTAQSDRLAWRQTSCTRSEITPSARRATRPPAHPSSQSGDNAPPVRGLLAFPLESV